MPIKKVILLLTIFIVFFSCKDDEIDKYEQLSPVKYEVNQNPHEKLSDYNFFEGNISDLKPVYGVLPYKLINKLFTDYAHKKRFIWMPNNVKASYVSDIDLFDFPTGTILIKDFYYDNVLPNNLTKHIETRIMIKKDTEWIFANYVWNDSQTDAILDLSQSTISIDWKDDSNITKHVDYRIPGESECLSCHKVDLIPYPIGPKPKSLNTNYTFENGTKNQLSKWVEMGYLENNYPSNILTVVNWKDESKPLELRARAYLDINCAHCHNDSGHCNYRSMRFDYERTSDPNNLGICIEPDEIIDGSLAYIATPGNAQKSVIYYRLNSTDETIRMPLLGRNLIHQEAVQLIDEWIQTIDMNCN